MPTPGQRLSSSSRDLTLVVESESGTPQEFFAQVGLSIGRAKSNTIHIDHPDLDHIHAKVVKRDESFWLRCEGQAKLQVLEPEPGVVEEVELMPGLTIELGGVIIRCRQQIKGMGSLSDDYWAEAAGGERFRVESETFTGDLPKKIGPYEIRKFVARGGMGIVLRGIHQDTDQPAAVKLPPPDLNKDHQWLKRFELEVRTLKSVTHPNLVRLQDAGQEGELHWMAMDWVEGWTVGERLAAYKEAGEPMPLSEIQLVLRQVVEGLVALHAKGVVHRDLKPGNLLVGQDGGVKVADFGLAKQVGGEQSTFLTRTGTFAGTMHYMAPEQAEGMDITPATDVYALGVIWHELLTGKRPGRRLKIKEQSPECPAEWENLIELCLDDEATDRPGLDAIKQALEAERFEAVIPPTELEQEETPPAAQPETEQAQLLREELEPESVIEVEEPEPEGEDPPPEYEADEAEAEEPFGIEEEPEPVAADTGYTSYVPEPVRITGVKVKNWLVLAGIVLLGLVVYFLVLKGDDEIPVGKQMTKGPALATPKPPAHKTAHTPGARPVPKGNFSTINLAWIPGGTFKMGGTTGQKDEQPVHTVKLNGFWIGKFEVTNAGFSEFTKATGYKTVAEVAPKAGDFPDIPVEEFKKMDLKPGSIVFTPPDVDIAIERLNDHGMFTQWWKYMDGASWRFPQGPSQPGVKDKSNHPVVHIAWYDAVKYCEWKTKITGVTHRLPTEAEWEYAARGGLKEKEYIWGTEQEPLGEPMANIWHGRFPRENTKDDGFYYTAPVGTFPVNGYGIHDMAGNVWEWCADWYHPEYYSESVVSNPKGPSVDKSYDPNEPGAKKRVQRGGSFLCTDLYCGAFRPGRRMKTTPDTGMSHAGFRVLVEARPPATE